MSRLTSPCTTTSSSSSSTAGRSFGASNARPPTPQISPFSTVLPSPVFDTPKDNQGSFSDSGNWTPRFAEEYSVFNSTPGNLRGGPFGDFAASSSGGHKRLLSAEALAVTNPSTPLLPAPEPVQQLPLPAYSGRSDDVAVQKTASSNAKKARRDTLQELQVTQTVTPPPSVHKGSRRSKTNYTMQNDHGFGQSGFAGSSQNHEMHALMGNPEDMFNYPLSAPVTGPGSFWDPSVAMSMDLDFGANGVAMFQNAGPAVGAQRSAQAFTWNGDLPMFQDPLAPPIPATPDDLNFTRRDRALAPKPAVSAPMTALADSMPSASFGSQPMGDPFNLMNPDGAVNPGLLFSRPRTSAMETGFGGADPLHILEGATFELSGQGPADARRELLSARESAGSSSRMPNRSFASSPVKGSIRPGLGRSFSESRGKKPKGRGSVAPLAPAPPRGISSSGSAGGEAGGSSGSGSGSSSNNRPVIRTSGRSSPLKSQHRASELASIPESLSQPCARTSIKFTIDSKGRAHAETTTLSSDYVVGDRGISRSRSSRGLPRQRSWDRSEDDESTDDEPIIIPSRHASFNTSFALPDPRKPVGSIFHSSRRSISDKSTSTSTTADSLNAPLHEAESEAETGVNGHDDDGGDAASELRKVVQDRQKRSAKKGSKPQRLLTASAPFRGVFGETISPTSLTDFSQGSDSHIVRCVCNKNVANEEDGYMVQCESCEMWLHGRCINITKRSMPRVYICGFCANTPNAQGRGRDMRRSSTLGVGSALSPLTGKSMRTFR